MLLIFLHFRDVKVNRSWKFILINIICNKCREYQKCFQIVQASSSNNMIVSSASGSEPCVMNMPMQVAQPQQQFFVPLHQLQQVDTLNVTISWRKYMIIW